MISCDKLLTTRGMTIEAADTLIFLGDSEALDRSSVERLVLRAADPKAPSKLRFVVLVSSLGTRRSDKFPWSMQNSFTGILDKKRSVELGLEQLSKEEGFAFVTLHIGGMSKDKSKQDVSIVAGDEQEGEIGVTQAAEAVAQALMLQPAALNNSLSVIALKGNAPSQSQWDHQFSYSILTLLNYRQCSLAVAVGRPVPAVGWARSVATGDQGRCRQSRTRLPQKYVGREISQAWVRADNPCGSGRDSQRRSARL